MTEQADDGGDVLADALDRRIETALSVAPEYTLPAGFAARVAAALPVEDARKVGAPFRYGPAAVLGCAAVLTAVLVWVAPAAPQTPVWLTSMLSLELTGLSLGLGLWWRESGWLL